MNGLALAFASILVLLLTSAADGLKAHDEQQRDPALAAHLEELHAKELEQSDKARQELFDRIRSDKKLLLSKDDIFVEGMSVGGEPNPETDIVEIRRSVKSPYHTWIHFAEPCPLQTLDDSELAHVDGSELKIFPNKEKFWCPRGLPYRPLVADQDIGFSLIHLDAEHSTFVDKVKAKVAVFPGSFATEVDVRQHFLWRRIVGVPPACARLVFAKLLNEFLQVESEDPEKRGRPITYVLAEPVLRPLLRLPAKIKSIISQVVGRKGPARVISTGDMDEAVCWTFTSRYAEAMENFKEILNEKELENRCDNDYNRDFMDQYMKYWVPFKTFRGGADAHDRPKERFYLRYTAVDMDGELVEKK